MVEIYKPDRGIAVESGQAKRLVNKITEKLAKDFAFYLSKL